uniref:Protein phosphatase 1 regulatory subunit n=1 Tax=Sinocyclocheilus rhinocerous TaxID=307959 RepID=A0A673H912_9TELE
PLPRCPLPRPSALCRDSGSIKYIFHPRQLRSARLEGMKMADAKQKRNEQLKRWIGSETDLEPPVLKKKKTKVKFDDGAVFLAACSSGDTEEVLRMLDRCADINYANVDGLTALHQACIDDNVDMVTFLVEHGACINQPDNEGWIPLHAAASCGYLDIAEYLISQGANVGVVNSEGETPLDIAEEEAMEELLQNEINRQGVDIEAARKEEERIMLRDARQWLNSGHINDVRHTKSGGTALHVAAAKGYAEVLKLLIQAGYDVNIKDYDGWTPLHAAAHWGKEEACRILVEHLCEMDIVNKVGQTAFDVADEDILGYLEELQKKQNLLLSEKKDVKKSPLIETTTTGDNNQSNNLDVLPKRTNFCFPPPSLSLSVVCPPQVSTPAGKVSPKEEERKDESPASWRLGLRKTGSYGALAEISTTKEAQKEQDTAGVMRSASSPRLSSSLDNKDKEKEKEKTRLAYVAPTIPRRHVSTSDIDEKENRDSAASLVRSGSYTRRRWEEDLKNNDGTASQNRTSSYQRSTSHTLALGRTSSSCDLPAKSSSASSLEPNNSKAWQQPSSYYQSYSIHRRYLPEHRPANTHTHSMSSMCLCGVTLTDLQEAEKTIGRSRPTWPREDEKEEKEKQDKEKQEEKKETETKEDDYRSRYRSFEEKYRSTSLASTTTASSTLPSSSSSSSSSLYSTSSLNRPNSLSGLTSTYSRTTRVTERESDRKEKEDDRDAEDKSQPRSIRDRRRPREKRRSTGVSFWTQDSDENEPEQPSDSEEGSTKGEPQYPSFSPLRYDPVSTSTSYLDRYESLSSRGIGESRRPYSRFERDDTTDYKKLYEQILAENEKLKAQLRDTELELADLKLQLEKATQERRALERKISEMEEELKVLFVCF